MNNSGFNWSGGNSSGGNSNLFANNNILNIKSICEELRIYQGQIEPTLVTFDDVINNANVSAWVSDTEVGQEIKQKIINNNEKFKELADAILEIYQQAMQAADSALKSNSSK